MANRHSRDFDALSEAQIAAGRMAGRRVAKTAPAQLATPRTMAGLLDTIQHIAEAATGERSFQFLDHGTLGHVTSLKRSA